MLARNVRYSIGIQPKACGHFDSSISSGGREEGRGLWGSWVSLASERGDNAAMQLMFILI